MKINRILLYFALPTLAPLILPPDILLKGLGAVLAAAALLLFSGYMLHRGNALALTFLIFLQGLNFVVKTMLFYSASVSASGAINWAFAVTTLSSMALSFYLLFRLDQVDIRSQLKS